MTNRYALPRGDHWGDHAACLGHGDLFLPRDDHTDTSQAKAICHRCPVTAACLTAALKEERGNHQHIRAGVRGGLTPAERADADRTTLASRTAAATAQEAHRKARDKAVALLHQGRTDHDIATETGLGRTTVSRLRRDLNIPNTFAARTPEQVYADLVRPTGDGHMEWTGRSRQATIRGRFHTAGQLAFLVSHGREPEGNVTAWCGRAGCVDGEHLADQLIRERWRQGQPA